MKIVAALVILSVLAGCETIQNDVESTPTGSVLSGETRSVEGYLDRVEEKNRAKKETYEKYGDGEDGFVTTPSHFARERYDR